MKWRTFLKGMEGTERLLMRESRNQGGVDADQDKFHHNFIYSRYLPLEGQNVKKAVDVLQLIDAQ